MNVENSSKFLWIKKNMIFSNHCNTIINNTIQITNMYWRQLLLKKKKTYCVQLIFILLRNNWCKMKQTYEK